MKILIILLSLSMFFSLSASNAYWEGTILEKMLLSMTNDKTPVIFFQSEHINKIVKHMKKIHIVNKCIKADFILSDIEDINKSCTKPKIVFNYRAYHNNVNAVAVFFWQKGRPTIRFSAKRLHHYGLVVNGELSKFVSSSN